MKRVVFAGLALIVSGCAATYQPPQTSAQNAAAPYKGSVTDGLKAARRALVSAGYQITASDDASGTISTAPRDLHVTPMQADCGTTMGLDYLLDNRTTTRVSYGVIVDARSILVQATVQGEYKPGQVDQNITLTCVSHGVLERDMLAGILAQQQ